jgi:hypothetical protein
MKRFAALLVLAACAHHHAEEASSDYVPDSRREHPCDPKGAEVARYVEPAALERDLSPDELALRGECFDHHTESMYRPRTPDELSMDLMRDVLSGGRECTGVCAPMNKALPDLDDKHDLEDETLQRECTAAAAKLEAKIRGGCRHVCLVERRKLASKAIFARTMRGLFTFARGLPDGGDARQAWTAANLPLPPRRFRLEIVPGKEMRADGAFYSGGPPLRLRLVEGNAGCGQSQWTVDTW